MIDSVDRFGSDAIGITIRDRPGLIQIDQGSCHAWKICGNGPVGNIIRPLTGDRHIAFDPRYGVIGVKFKEIT